MQLPGHCQTFSSKVGFALACAALVISAQACSASESTTGSSGGSHPTTNSGGSAGSDGSGGTIVTTTSGGSIGVGGTGGSGGLTNECGTASADAVLQSEPVDIIMVIDNSGSMGEEIDAVENNINTSFGSILTTAGIDYRLIAISRHDDGSVDTSLCITQPLSSLATCPAPAPGISERFFHFNTKIESDDSLDKILDSYIAPFGECLSLCSNGDPAGPTADSDADDNSKNTEVGWSEWLRPGAKKVFLAFTDADDDLTSAAFVQALTALSPDFGTAEAPTFTFHSIVGVAEKGGAAYLPDEPLVVEDCATADPNVSMQELSILTGGLRFPICSTASYDAVFNEIANDVVVKAELACDFAIPVAPDGREIERDKVAVSYSSAGAVVSDFGQAATSADCQANAFYIENDRVWLCPETCDAIKADPMASVDVLFTCESTIIVK